MLSSRFSNPWIWFLVFALLFSVQVIPRIVNDSPTDDEPMDIADGYACWKGDVISNGTHPVFLKMLQTLPLKFMDVKDAGNGDMGLDHLQPGDSLAMLDKRDQSRLDRFKSFLNFNMGQCQLRGYQFLFVLNKDIFETMLQRCRFITFLFGLGIGLLLFGLTRQSHPIVTLSALALWAFEPTLSAFSAQCGSDVPAAFFILAAVLAFQKHLENQDSLWSLAAGALLGGAVGSKFSALFIIPALMLLEAFHYWRSSSSSQLSKILKKLDLVVRGLSHFHLRRLSAWHPFRQKPLVSLSLFLAQPGFGAQHVLSASPDLLFGCRFPVQSLVLFPRGLRSQKHASLFTFNPPRHRGRPA